MPPHTPETSRTIANDDSPTPAPKAWPVEPQRPAFGDAPQPPDSAAAPAPSAQQHPLPAAP